MLQDGALHLLLAHADIDRPDPVLDGGLPAEAASVVRRPFDGVLPLSRRIESERPDDLPAQRWGVIAPSGELGDRLLACVQPLIDLRQAQQGGAPPLILRAPPDAALSQDDAQRWRDANYDELDKDPGDRTRAEDQPAYLLILGDLHQVPETLHQILGSDCFVGRLAFSTQNGEPELAGYEAYVDKIIRWERKPADAQHAYARLLVVDDGSSATLSSRLALLEPALSLARRDLQLGRLPTFDPQLSSELGIVSPVELFSQARKSGIGVLLSASHGLGAPRGGWESVELQHQQQGAMHFGRAGRLTGGDVARGVFLPGGIWFMLACYSAGTPLSSHFRPWLEQLQQAGQFSEAVQKVLAGLPRPGERPFIAALPQALLANPEGPLAFLGHLDLAWSYGFQDLSTGMQRNQPERFLNLISSLLRHHRVGVALRELTRYIGSTNAQLTRLYSKAAETGTPMNMAQLAHLWMVRQDLMGYLLLGDPAARLPLQAPAS